MNIEAIILGIAILLCGYYAGYAIGFKRGLEYLMGILRNMEDENNDNMR